MIDTRSENITWHTSKVQRDDRYRLNGHRGCVLWLTGLSAAGKSTLACELENLLLSHGVRSYVLDGDNVRHGLNRDLGFSPEDRTENIRRIGEVSSLFADGGLVTLVSLISPYRADRQMVREMLPPGTFIEVYVKCRVNVCADRDPKGVYNKALAGKIPNFTGISAPYEEPEQPELVIDTEKNSVQESVQAIFRYLKQQGIFRLPS